MTWKDDKDLGPSSFNFAEQRNKWGYLNNPRWTTIPEAPVNYDGRESEEPQVFTPYQGKQDANDSDEHVPCGHWHKVGGPPGTSPPSALPAFETYFELLPGSVSHPDLRGANNDLLSAESFIPINANDFDEDYEWDFEVIAFNSNTFDITLQAVDTDGTVCATVVIPAGTVGVTGYELYRFRETFTPTITDDVKMYGLKISKPGGNNIYSYPLKCAIHTARIIVRQAAGASMTKIQVPLFGSSYNYTLEEDSDYPYDTPIGWALYEAHTPTTIPSDAFCGYQPCSIWQFKSEELNRVSKLVFSPVAKGPIDASHVSRTFYVFSTLNFQHFHYQLYKTTANDSARKDATPFMWTSQNTVHVDNVSGLTYTPIPSSYIYWQSGIDPYPFDYVLYPDFSGVAGGNRIAVGGELYFGLPLENQWEHWQTWFTLTIPSGAHVENAVLHVYSTSGNQMTWNLEYDLVPNDDLTLSLFDITDNAVVPGSELTWTIGEGFSRKFAEINLGYIIQDHEYRLGIDFGVDYGYPEIMDAQLLINVEDIEALTVWQRCASRHGGEYDNWWVPDAWGADFYGDAEGSISVGHRAKMFQPADPFDVYFEVTIFGITAGVGEGDRKRVWLEDLGADGSSGSTGSDVAGSLIEWDEDTLYKLNRKRSGPLVLTHDNEYCDRNYNISGNDMYLPNGFLVIRVI